MPTTPDRPEIPLTRTGTSATHPPPVIRLPTADRLRLLRSTRKIMSLTGETPHVVGLARSPSASAPLTQTYTVPQMRQADGAPEPGDSAAVQCESAAPDSAGRPMLCIRMPNPSLGIDWAVGDPSAAGTTPARTPSPSLTVALQLDVTTSSSDADGTGTWSSIGLKEKFKEKDDAARRRTMAKLTRTLGERVPQALVFPAPPPKLKLRPKRRKTLQLHADRSLRAESIAARRARRERKGWVVVKQPDLERDTTRTNAGADDDERFNAGNQEHASGWVDRQIPKFSVAHPYASTVALAPSNWVSVRGPDAGSDEEHRRMVEAGLGVTEEDWSGEWVGGVRNMDEVLWHLRNLRVK